MIRNTSGESDIFKTLKDFEFTDKDLHDFLAHIKKDSMYIYINILSHDLTTSNELLDLSRNNDQLLIFNKNTNKLRIHDINLNILNNIKNYYYKILLKLSLFESDKRFATFFYSFGENVLFNSISFNLLEANNDLLIKYLLSSDKDLLSGVESNYILKCLPLNYQMQYINNVMDMQSNSKDWEKSKVINLIKKIDMTSKISKNNKIFFELLQKCLDYKIYVPKLFLMYPSIEEAENIFTKDYKKVNDFSEKGIDSQLYLFKIEKECTLFDNIDLSKYKNIVLFDNYFYYYSNMNNDQYAKYITKNIEALSYTFSYFDKDKKYPFFGKENKYDRQINDYIYHNTPFDFEKYVHYYNYFYNMDNKFNEEQEITNQKKFNMIALLIKGFNPKTPIFSYNKHQYLPD